MNIDILEDFIQNNDNIDQLYYIIALAEKKIKNLNPVGRYAYFEDLEKFLADNFTNFTHEIVHANHWRKLQNTNFDKDLNFIQLHDAYEYDFSRSFTEKNHSIDWFYRKSEQIKFLTLLAEKYPEKLFVLLTSLQFLDREIDCDLPNFVPVFIGGDIFKEDYKGLDMVYTKHIEHKHVVCLNNNPRPHRVATVLYMMHTKLDQYCNMSFLSNDIRKTYTWQEIETELYNVYTVSDWIYYPDIDLKNQLEELSKNIKNYDFLVENVFSDLTNEFKNSSPCVFNFNQRLSKIYQNSLVEIITESTCFEPTLNLTEKYTNSIYGCNLPIFISTQGTVKYLRQLGFDTFDDVIDHSYDDEVNPFYRLKKAIDLNRNILSNSDLAMEQWEKNKQRFIDNKNFYETKLYDMINKNRNSDLLTIKDKFKL